MARCRTYSARYRGGRLGNWYLYYADGCGTGYWTGDFCCSLSNRSHGYQWLDLSKLSQLGAPTLLSALDKIASGIAVAEQQDDSLSSYARKIDKSEALLIGLNPLRN